MYKMLYWAFLSKLNPANLGDGKSLATGTFQCWPKLCRPSSINLTFYLICLWHCCFFEVSFRVVLHILYPHCWFCGFLEICGFFLLTWNSTTVIASSVSRWIIFFPKACRNHWSNYSLSLFSHHSPCDCFSASSVSCCWF